MTDRRILSWEGCNNVRDLGGFLTRDGCLTRWGAVVRSDHPAKLTAVGWEALYAHGIRTIISLRSDGIDEDRLDSAPRPPDIQTVCVAIEDLTDASFVRQWVDTNLWGTPLYFRDALERWPERHRAAIAAVANAQPGGVLFHCGRGYDRTGIIALLLLALAGVSPEDITADYELSVDSYRDELLKAANTTALDVIRDTLEQIDVAAYLRASGLSQAELDSLRQRLIE